MPEIIFNGPEGRLEGRYSEGKSPVAPIAVILHPHPEHGGTMNNKVVYQMFHLFKRRGFATLRFNFRGVGRSQGVYDEGEGELSDAAAAMDWLQTQNPNARFSWVCGFSFGAWIGMQLLMRRPEIDGFVSIAPPANMFDFNFLAPCPSDGLLIQGTSDTIVPEPAVAKLAHKLAQQKGISIDYRTIQGADHFFTEHLTELVQGVDQHLMRSIQEKLQAA